MKVYAANGKPGELHLQSFSIFYFWSLTILVIVTRIPMVTRWHTNLEISAKSVNYIPIGSCLIKMVIVSQPVRIAIIWILVMKSFAPFGCNEHANFRRRTAGMAFFSIMWREAAPRWWAIMGLLPSTRMIKVTRKP